MSQNKERRSARFRNLRIRLQKKYGFCAAMTILRPVQRGRHGFVNSGRKEPVNANIQQVHLEWDDVRQEITLTSKLFLLTNPAASPTVLTFDQRRGASCDRYGNWYWIDDTQSEIRVNSAGTGTTAHFWSADDLVEIIAPAAKGTFQATTPQLPPPPLSLRGLAVTEHHYLVVGVVQPQAGLLIFDLHSSGAPRQLFWPSGIDFQPFEITAAPGGGIYILDRANHRYWRLDRQFNVVREVENPQPSPDQKDTFQPKDGSSTRPRLTTAAYTRPISVDDAITLPLTNPVAIEALPDCSVLILDSKVGNNFSDIYRYLDGVQKSVTSLDVIIKVLEDKAKAGFSLIGYDFAFVPERLNDDGTIEIPDLLFVVSTRGEQGFAFHPFLGDDQLNLQPTTQYFPMHLFSGKGLETFCEQVYYDLADIWLPLTAQARRRYEPMAILYTPAADPNVDVTITGNAFNGHVPDCVWHRLLLDACIPPETSVQVFSRAANSQDELARMAWQLERPLYMRRDGSELPFMPRSSTKDRGTWELLFQQARGQYLQLKLVLQGNEHSTPRISALRVYYPRFSYLEQYLPATYREDRASASFLDRYLANMEGFYTAIEDKIAAMQVLFDAYSAPPEALDWLAGWFGILLDTHWDDQRKRLFIRHAMDFFQYRSTIRGLQMALRLALDSCTDESIFTDTPSRTSHIRIIEKYRTRHTPGILFGDTTDLGGIRVINEKDRWTPDQRGEVLNKKYTQDVGPRDFTGTIPFPITDPGGDASLAWQQFSQRRLGFIPSIKTVDRSLWQNFLARRYQTIQAYNDAYLDELNSLRKYSYQPSPSCHRMANHWWIGISLSLSCCRCVTRRTTLSCCCPYSVQKPPIQRSISSATNWQSASLCTKNPHTHISTSGFTGQHSVWKR